MKVLFASLGGCLAIGLVTALPTARAEEPVRPAVSDQEPVVHRMVIYNGSVRSVHYFAPGATRAEDLALQDVALAENERALADQLQSLRRQYVGDEGALEARRRRAQELFIGLPLGAGLGAATVPLAGVTGVTPTPYYSLVTGASIYRPNLTAVSFYANGMLANGGYTPWLPPSYGSYPYAGGLGNSFSEPGPVKTEIARTIAVQATPQFVTQTNENLQAALVRASSSGRLRSALGLDKDGGILAAGFETPSAQRPQYHVTVTMKNGDKIEGKLVREDGDRVVVATDTQEVEIRKNETSTIAKKPLKAPRK
ncbi:MAG: hypothetical protein JO112_22340 [Planctomycetes bacterium]|nr:hypothetical protein [Planctomycetota bacterium]